ncbi:MAG: MlaD family protein [Gemmatimonadaceae bacterium]
MSGQWGAADRRAGIILAIVAVLLVGTLGWLALDVTGPEERWYADFDRVEGLALQAPVRVEGFTVGRVTAVQPLIGADGHVRFRVSLRIPVTRDPIPLPEGTVARISPPLLAGQGALELVRPIGMAATLSAGSVLPGELAPGLVGELALTVERLRRTAESITRLSDTMTTLSAGVRGDITGVARSASAMLVRAESTIAALQSEIAGLGEVVDAGRQVPERIVALVDSLDRLAGETRAAIVRADGMLAAEGPQIRRIVAQLDTATAAMNHVIKRFARRPLRIFTGLDTTNFPPPAPLDTTRRDEGRP